MGYKKVKDIVGCLFTWPGVRQDIVQWCQSCEPCQKSNKSLLLKAPMQPIRVITEPYEKVAFDLVGPFYRSNYSHKYLLTAICLATHFPHDIPLKDIGATTVAEAMTRLFMEQGIPLQILMDQGYQFVCELMSQVCSLLIIDHLKTTPYHPQSNGCL